MVQVSLGKIEGSFVPVCVAERVHIGCTYVRKLINYEYTSRACIQNVERFFLRPRNSP